MADRREGTRGASDDLTSLSASRLAGVGKRAFVEGDRARWRACVRELERRGSRTAEDAADGLRSLDQDAARKVKPRGRSASAGPPPAWVARLARIAREFEPESGPCAGRDYSVYVTLLERDGSFGVYVGLTHQTPEARFAQQKSGVKAGRGYVRDHGVRVLEEVCGHLRGTLSFEEAGRIERQLWSRFDASGVWAEGGH